ncbi:hypothetical protein J6590_045889 [Homalodisca vitripennis]|nr:hypothetical protein J6590_045889 [Homalodisca vitripennis]
MARNLGLRSLVLDRHNEDRASNDVSVVAVCVPGSKNQVVFWNSWIRLHIRTNWLLQANNQPSQCYLMYELIDDKEGEERSICVDDKVRTTVAVMRRDDYVEMLQQWEEACINEERCVCHFDKVRRTTIAVMRRDDYVEMTSNEEKFVCDFRQAKNYCCSDEERCCVSEGD